jgi:Tat protein secretion system quality control protein TatD with DNase activity
MRLLLLEKIFRMPLDLNQAGEMADFIRQHHSSLAAIGEVGLDYWVVKEAPDKAVQREILKRFIELAQELDLPLNVHSRSAGRHAIALLLDFQSHLPSPVPARNRNWSSGYPFLVC